MKPDSNNKFLKDSEIKKTIWKNPPKKWLSITDILSEKIVFEINEAICQLIDCVDYEYEEFVRDKDRKEFIIKIPPTFDYNNIFLHTKTLEAQKFLVFLLRKNIISNLHLPISIKFKKTKGVVLIGLRNNLYCPNNKFALSDALLKPKKFKEEIISFKIVNWDEFSKIKNKIKKSNKYKDYEKNEKKTLFDVNIKTIERQKQNNNNKEGADDKQLQEATKEQKKIANKNGQVSVFEEKGVGYLKFYKQGPKIKIGGSGTRKFKLLMALSSPLKVAKTVNTVFECIALPKDANNSLLKDNYLSANTKRTIIEYTIKELQKIKELKGKIKLEFIDNKKSVFLSLDT